MGSTVSTSPLLALAVPTALDTLNAMRRVNTLADLTATLKSGLVDGETAVVGYYSSSLDNGGGRFKWDASSTATAIAGYVVAADEGGNGRWLRLDDEMSPERFGALGDGSTDDTAALLAFFNAGGGRMRPFATYIHTGITPTAPFCVDMRGATLKMDDTTAASQALLMEAAAAGSILVNGVLDGNRVTRRSNATGNTRGIIEDDGADGCLWDVKIDNFDGAPFRSQSHTENGIYRRIECDGNGGSVSLQAILFGRFGYVSNINADTDGNGENNGERAIILGSLNYPQWGGAVFHVRGQTIDTVGQGMGVLAAKIYNANGIAHFDICDPASIASGSQGLSIVSLFNAEYTCSIRATDPAAGTYDPAIEFRGAMGRCHSAYCQGNFAAATFGFRTSTHSQMALDMGLDAAPDTIPQHTHTGHGGWVGYLWVGGYNAACELKNPDVQIDSIQVQGANINGVEFNEETGGQLFFDNTLISSALGRNIQVGQIIAKGCGRSGVAFNKCQQVQVGRIIAEYNGADTDAPDDRRSGVATLGSTGEKVDVHIGEIQAGILGVTGHSADVSASMVAADEDLDNYGRRSGIHLVHPSSGTSEGLFLGAIISLDGFAYDGTSKLPGRVVDRFGDEITLEMEQCNVNYTGLAGGTYSVNDSLTFAGGATGKVRVDNGSDKMIVKELDCSAGPPTGAITNNTNGSVTATASRAYVGNETLTALSGGSNWSIDATGLIATCSSGGAVTTELNGQYWVEFSDNKRCRVLKYDEGDDTKFYIHEDTPATASATGLSVSKSESAAALVMRQQHGLNGENDGDFDRLYVGEIHGRYNEISLMHVHENNFTNGSRVVFDTNNSANDGNGGKILNTGGTNSNAFVIASGRFIWESVRGKITTAVTTASTLSVSVDGNTLASFSALTVNTNLQANFNGPDGDASANVLLVADVAAGAGAARLEMWGRATAKDNFADV